MNKLSISDAAWREGGESEPSPRPQSEPKPMTCKPARILEIPNDDYHAMTDHVSCSMAKVALDSFSDYAAAYVHKTVPPQPSSKAMDIGSVADAVALEGKDFDDLVGIYPASCLKSNGAINRTRCDEWEETQRMLGKQYFFKAADGERVCGIIDALRQSIVGQWLASPYARVQKSITWHDGEFDLPMRCRPDLFITTVNDFVYAFDLKTSAFYTPREFRRRVKAMRYWLQEQIYTRGLQHAFPGMEIAFRFIVVNPEQPHQVAVYSLDAESRASAELRFRELFHEIGSRYRSGNWMDEWQNNDNEISLGRFDFE